jgi:hypothetical protein
MVQAVANGVFNAQEKKKNLSILPAPEFKIINETSRKVGSYFMIFRSLSTNVRCQNVPCYMRRNMIN